MLVPIRASDYSHGAPASPIRTANENGRRAMDAAQIDHLRQLLGKIGDHL